MKKLYISLLNKSLVSKIDLKYNPWPMELEERGTLCTIPMSWIQRSLWCIDLIQGHHSMAHLSSSPRGFQGHMLNPYPRHRIQIMQQDCVLGGVACVFCRFHMEIIATSSSSRNLKSRFLCAKISDSHTEQNPSFQNWPKIGSIVHGTRGKFHP